MKKILPQIFGRLNRDEPFRGASHQCPCQFGAIFVLALSMNEQAHGTGKRWRRPLRLSNVGTLFARTLKLPPRTRHDSGRSCQERSRSQFPVCPRSGLATQDEVPRTKRIQTALVPEKSHSLIPGLILEDRERKGQGKGYGTQYSGALPMSLPRMAGSTPPSDLLPITVRRSKLFGCLFADAMDPSIHFNVEGSTCTKYLFPADPSSMDASHTRRPACEDQS